MNWWCWVPQYQAQATNLAAPLLLGGLDAAVDVSLLGESFRLGPSSLNGISHIACMADEPNIPRILILGKS